MITQDIKLFEQIVGLIHYGLVAPYSSWQLEVLVGEGYIQHCLEVDMEGVKTTTAETTMDSLVLYDHLRQWKYTAQARGELCGGFTLSYTPGGQAHVVFV